jgi:transmembrane sensor
MNVRLTYLYQRYIDETCTAAEREEFLSVVAANTEDQQIAALMDGTWNKTGAADGVLLPNAGNVLDSILTQHKKPVVKKISWYRYTAVAAAVLVMLSAGIYFFTNYLNTNNQPGNLAVTDNIQAGKNRATLTLANGTIINLDSATDGEIARQAGIAITKTAGGQLVYNLPANSAKENAPTAYNTIATPRGGQYQVNLPDGTKIWLNAASTLKYPAVFNGTERRVELTGEAYFEVAKVMVKDKGTRMPFIVATDKQEIEVLGTHFNVNSYTDESAAKTTLLEGAVRVTLNDSQTTNHNPKTANLLPGQQSQIKGTALQITNVDTEEAVAWKNGYFQFNESDLGSIMRQLSRWYNVDVVFEGRSPDELFHLKTPRNLSLNEVLKIFEINGINLKIEGRKLIVKS